MARSELTHMITNHNIPTEQRFETILSLITNNETDTETRLLCETTLVDLCLKTPFNSILTLINLLSNNNVQIRSLSAILLRRFMFKSTRVSKANPKVNSKLYNLVSTKQKMELLDSLLNTLINEPIGYVRNKLTDLIHEFYLAFIMDKIPLDSLTSVILRLIDNNTDEMKELGLRLMAFCPESLLLIKPEFIQLVNNAIITGLESDDQLFDALGELIDLLYSNDSWVPQYVEPIVHFMAKIIDCNTVEDRNFMSFFIGSKNAAIEVIATVAENQTDLVNESQHIIPLVIPLLLRTMSTIKDDEEWYTTEDIEDDEENDSVYVVAECALDRLATELDERLVANACFSFIPNMTKSTVWQERYAALCAISLIAEGCKNILVEQLESILAIVIPLYNDANDRVVYACCKAIGQMATHLQKKICDKYHNVMMSSIVNTLNTQHCNRVYEHIAASLVNITEVISSHNLCLYTNELISGLVKLLDSPVMYLQIQVLITIGVIAEKIQDNFQEYYAYVMPGVVSKLSKYHEQEHENLVSEALETFSLVVVAVGTEMFMKDSNHLLNMLMQIQTTFVNSDSIIFLQLQQTWLSVCQVMEKEFVPYLDMIMPPLLQMAARPEEEIEEKYDESDDSDDEIGLPSIKNEESYDKQNTNRTQSSVLDEKIDAIELLSRYGEVLETNFTKYAYDVLINYAMPIMEHSAYQELKQYAAECVPIMLNIIVKANASEHEIHQIWSKIYMISIGEMSALDFEIEEDLRLCYQLYITLGDSIEVLNSEIISDKQIQTMLKYAFKHVNKIKKDYERSYFQNQDDEYEDVESDSDKINVKSKVISNNKECYKNIDIGEFEKELVDGITIFVQNLLKACRQRALVFIEKLGIFVSKLTYHNCPSLRNFAVCFIDSYVEFAFDENWKLNSLIMSLEEYLKNSDSEILRGACFGIGLVAQFTDAKYLQLCERCAPILNNIINCPGSRSEDSICATENAISAIGKILKYKYCILSQPINSFSEGMVLSWINMLPIENDLEEVQPSYEFLIQLLESSNLSNITNKPENIAKCMYLFALLLSKINTKEYKKIKLSIGNKAVEMFNKIEQVVTNETKQKIWSSLNNKQKISLGKFFGN